MARDKDATRGKVVASVPLVFLGVSEEETEGQIGSQLVRSGSSGVQVTRTLEDSKVIVARRGTKKSMVCVGAGQAAKGRRLRR